VLANQPPLTYTQLRPLQLHRVTGSVDFSADDALRALMPAFTHWRLDYFNAL